jgi:hypothetical protein
MPREEDRSTDRLVGGLRWPSGWVITSPLVVMSFDPEALLFEPRFGLKHVLGSVQIQRPQIRQLTVGGSTALTRRMRIDCQDGRRFEFYTLEDLAGRLLPYLGSIGYRI